MNELVRHFLKRNGPVLCLDIGSGTQDALLARPGLELHNWPRFVLPSPARLAAQRIRELTLLKCNVWLYGGNIGGGCTQAVREHLAAGLSVASTTAASRGLHDAVEVVEGMGVQLREQCPEGYVPLFLTDYTEEELLAPMPYAESIYCRYLQAMIAAENCESAKYNQQIVLYNGAFQQYRDWICRRGRHRNRGRGFIF